MWSSLQSLAGYSFTVVSKAIESFCPVAKPLIELVQQIREQYEKHKEKVEREQIREALEISWERMGVIDELMQLLGSRCGDLLTRMEALERKGQDSSEVLIRAAIESPELQAAFDAFGNRFARLEGRVGDLEGDVRRLDERYASLQAFAEESRGKYLSDTEIRDFRAFRRAKAYQAEGQYTKSAEVLQQLANQLPNSPAVAVALAVAHHEDPREFDTQIKRAVRLKPNDTDLKALASAATVAVTGRVTPANPKSSPSLPPIMGIENRDPKAGDTLDGWLLEAKIGGGGWGLVFRANKRGQVHALKVMRRHLAENPDFKEIFNDEVFNLVRLPAHRNVIPVERNGVCLRFGCPYFTMPLLSGMNLEQHLERNGVPSSEIAMQWLMGLLDALEHAHNHGLIHRDVKPQNVMILPDGRPVLIDFGIAGLADVPGYTQAIGKSSFFAPPELHGLGQADVRADLFMLAATMFYAFRYDKPMAERVCYRYEARLVPDAFAMALEAALASNPDKRPANVLEMRGLLKVNAAELEFRRKEREEAEARERERLEKAKQEAERERQKKEAEEAERRRQDEAARKQREHEELCRRNFERWKATDIAEKWVAERLPDWNDKSFKKLMSALEEHGRYWPMAEADIGRHLEGIRDRLNAEQRLREAEETAQQKAQAERKGAVEKRKDVKKFRRKTVVVVIGACIIALIGWGVISLPWGKWFGGNKQEVAGNKQEVSSGKQDLSAQFENRDPSKAPPLLDCTIEGGVNAKTVRAAQVAWAKYLKEPSYEKDFPLTKDGKETITMILLPPSKYYQGDDKQNIITLTQPLWVSKYEVTQKQNEVVMGNNPSYFKKQGDDAGKYPVEMVSHDACTEFAKRASVNTNLQYRLLTEAEWEYAYRAGTRTKFYNGDSEDNLGEIAQYKKNNNKNPEKVGSKAANAFGLYDMAGNVWEWTSTSQGASRIYRGGSWYGNAEYCEAACRSALAPSNVSSILGFRLLAVPLDK